MPVCPPAPFKKSPQEQGRHPRIAGQESQMAPEHRFTQLPQHDCILLGILSRASCDKPPPIFTSQLLPRTNATLDTTVPASNTKCHCSVPSPPPYRELCIQRLPFLLELQLHSLPPFPGRSVFPCETVNTPSVAMHAPTWKMSDARVQWGACTIPPNRLLLCLPPLPGKQFPTLANQKILNFHPHTANFHSECLPEFHGEV